MSVPLVSAVIPNYNYGQYLVEAIQSVLDQTYQNIEIIVVDDGSTDNSADVAKGFGAAITFIRQKNQGVVVARDNGAKIAKGEYIFFLDADDVIKPDYVSSLMQALEQTGAAVAYCDFEYFGMQSHIVTSCPWNPRKLLYRNYIIAAALIRRSVFEEIGGFSIEVNQKASFEDWDLWLSITEAGYAGVYVPEPLFRYRLHGKGRNVAALTQRRKLEHILEQRHPKLYQDPTNKLYLAVSRTASRLRNALIKAPGT